MTGQPSSSARRTGKAWERQRVLAELIRWAQEHPVEPGYGAGPTTDPATIAARILRTGRVRVRTRGVPAGPIKGGSRDD